MAYSLYSPPYSFVQYRAAWDDLPSWIEDSAEGNELDLSLPCNTAPALLNELSHQFIVEGSSTEADALMAMSPLLFNLFVIPSDGMLTPPPTNSLVEVVGWIFQMPFSTSWYRYRLNSNQVLFYIPTFPSRPKTGGPGPVPTWETFDGKCFQLVFQIRNTASATSPLLKVISNVFRFQKDLSYTTFMRYKGSQDEAGFRYCPEATIINAVRVPMYMKAAQYPEEVSAYRTSQGDLKVSKEVVTKQYEVVTEQMPEWMHDCLRAALVHDQLYFRGKRYTGNARKNGPYNVEWKEHDYPLGAAEFKLDISPLVIKNNNCGVCTTTAPPLGKMPLTLTDSTPVSTTSSIGLTAALETELAPADVDFGFEIIAPAGVIVSASIITNQQNQFKSLQYTLSDSAPVTTDLEAFVVWAYNDDFTSNTSIVSLTITQ